VDYARRSGAKAVILINDTETDEFIEDSYGFPNVRINTTDGEWLWGLYNKSKDVMVSVESYFYFDCGLFLYHLIFYSAM
jgi:hypothetical protein